MNNRVSLIGHVGQKPDVRTFENNRKKASFSLATNDYYINDKGERVDNTEWHSLVVWGKLADIVEKYVEKGREVVVEGKITYRSYDDKEGNKRNITEIVVSELHLCGKKADSK
jgi:single-strand DNA-binding protein